MLLRLAFLVLALMVCGRALGGDPAVPKVFRMPFVAKDAATAKAWQDRVRAELIALVQRLCPRQERPLDVHMESSEKMGGYTKTTLRFAGHDGTPIEATLTVPTGEGRFPAIVCLHGHGGDRHAVHVAQPPFNGFAAEYARRGFVTLAPSLQHCPYAAEQLWNLMRLVDVLEAQPAVDPARIGVAGLSMGGEWSMWLAACDLRIKAAVVSGWMCTTEGCLRVPNCPCWRPPELLDLCDIADVNIVIAPRPLLFQSAESDGCFPIDATRKGFRRVQRGYALLEAPDRVRQHVFPGGHEWNGAEAYPFMEQALKGAPERKCMGS